MNVKYLLLLLWLPLFSGCDKSDDVAGIFLDKQWQLTEIYYNENNLGMDYWTTDEAKNKSYGLLRTGGNFVVSFQGLATNGDITGTYTGKAVSGSLSGTWSADGESHKFTTSNQKATGESDPLAKAFVSALSNAYEFKGDYYNLRIYFTETNGAGKRVEKFLLFHVAN